MLASSAQLRIGRARAKAISTRPVAHNEHILGSLPAAGERDGAVGLIRCDHDVGKSERDLLKTPGDVVKRPSPAAEARAVQLRHKVMMVEYERGALGTEAAGGQQ